VVTDSTMPGAPSCDRAPASQDLGPVVGGTPAGRNGIEVFEVDGVSIENLTTCNFLTGSYGGGNQIWWNGGDGTGTVNLNGYHGADLPAAATRFPGPHAPRPPDAHFAHHPPRPRTTQP